MIHAAATTRAEAVFVGEDRRRAPDESDLARVAVIGASVVLLTAIVLPAIAAGDDVIDPARARGLRWMLETAVALAAVAVFALCRVRWRLVGGSASLWAGTGALAFGLAAVAGPDLAGPLLTGREPSAGSALVEAGLVVTLALLAVGALAPPVDTRLRPAPLVIAAAAAVAVLGALFAAVPDLGANLTVGALSGDGWAATASGVVMAGAWLTVASAYAVRGLRRRWLYSWCAALVFALLMAQLADAVAGSRGNAWPVVGDTLAAVGLLVAVVGCAVELALAYAEQRSRLFDSELTLEAAAVQDRLRAASQRTRRHDVRNAVVAIEGAAVTLERHVERLSEHDRGSLTRMLSSGVDRLQRLLEETRTEACVDLGVTAREVVDELGWEERVVVDVPGGLTGSGSPSSTAEVVRLLMDNAERRAPGEPITLRGSRDGAWVVLRVEDRGPGLSRQRRRAITEAPDGGGVGVLVAGRLLHEQGGDLWVEARPGGGCSFALCLPVPPVADEQEQGAAGS